jgi:hypothetical protein
MNIQAILNRASVVKAIDAPLTATTLVQKLAKESEATQYSCFLGDRVSGFVFLYSDTAGGRYVLETVQSGHGQDNLIALYEANGLFDNKAKVIQLRRDLIGAIEWLNTAAPGTIGADDFQRGRQVLLGELTTIQLIEMVKARQSAKAISEAIEAVPVALTSV